MAAAKEQAERMAVAMRAGEDPGFGQGAAGGQPPRVQTAGAGERGGDTISQLERLARLRDQGVLTEAEFQSQKQRILSG